MSDRQTIFFHLLRTPIDDKGDALRALVQRVSSGAEPEAPVDAFTLDPASFNQIPGSPFAYWVSDSMRNLFADLRPFESDGRSIRSGLKSAADDRFVSTWWEIPATSITSYNNDQIANWVPFAKGGIYSPSHIIYLPGCGTPGIMTWHSGQVGWAVLDLRVASQGDFKG